jgi:hypothetical protein
MKKSVGKFLEKFHLIENLFSIFFNIQRANKAFLTLKNFIGSSQKFGYLQNKSKSNKSHNDIFGLRLINALHKIANLCDPYRCYLNKC